MLFDTAKKIEIVPGYDIQFRKLKNIILPEECSIEWGERIKRYALEFASEIDLSHFQIFSGDSYMRNYLGRDNESGWEALIMGWSRGNRTAIHGHPKFASYTVVSGEIMLEVFEKRGDSLKKVMEYTARPGESFYAIGESDNYENHIHRLTGISDKAHTLHIYSDDARKGVNFDSYKII